MKSRVVLLALSVVFAASTSTRAGSVLLDAPAQYVPGGGFTVSVRLSAVADLALYNIELVIRTSGQSASLLTIPAPTAPASGYVFPTAAEFLANTRVLGAEYRITLSDFLLTPTGVNVAPGVNDRVTTLTIKPAVGLSGSVTVSVDPLSLMLDDSQGNSVLTPGPTPVVVLTEAVPSPSGLVCSLVGLATLAGHGLVKRKTRP